MSKNKVIPLRSKDGKHLSGSISLEGKRAPESKSFIATLPEIESKGGCSYFAGS